MGIRYLDKQPVDSTQSKNMSFLLQIPAQEIKSRDWTEGQQEANLIKASIFHITQLENSNLFDSLRG